MINTFQIEFVGDIKLFDWPSGYLHELAKITKLRCLQIIIFIH